MGTQPTAFCQSCGQPLTGASRFCNHCGQPQPTAEVVGASSAAAAPAFTPPTATAYAAAPAVATYAGFWVRFLAIVIDGLIVGVVTGPVVLIVEAMVGFGGGLLNDKGELNPGQIAMLAGMFAFIVAFSVAVKALYEALLTASSKQATVGKMVFRLKVTDLNGKRLTVLRAFGRHFAKYISGMTLLIGYLIQPFTERRQALHDMIAGTLVVRDVSPPYPIVPPQTAPPPAQL
jgi:uncharacterized RDD family membrane protein YckC